MASPDATHTAVHDRRSGRLKEDRATNLSTRHRWSRVHWLAHRRRARPRRSFRARARRFVHRIERQCQPGGRARRRQRRGRGCGARRRRRLPAGLPRRRPSGRRAFRRESPRDRPGERARDPDRPHCVPRRRRPPRRRRVPEQCGPQGGAAERPPPEPVPLTRRSPYAVSKMAGEHYCRVYTDLFGLETVSLRYFNVYGPRQRPDSPYAAVIPLFIEAMRKGEPPIVHGDGRQSRDFTYVVDAVAATLAAMDAPGERCAGRAYNIAPGESHDLLELLDILGRLLGTKPEPRHTAERAGDVRRTMADPSASRRDLGYSCRTGFEDGLRRTVEWFETR